MDELEVKQQVRQFYDRVGWQTISDGVYQNARYEDLRPVSHDYIHRCHLRVNRFLKPCGHFLLDAGSGPIQYPEYLTYSENYEARVCIDISFVALEEARKRISSHGRFVVADVANLPFKPGVFDGIVSLHTLHHLPSEEQMPAYFELYRVLAPGCCAAVINGWTESKLMNRMKGLIVIMERLEDRFAHSRKLEVTVHETPVEKKEAAGDTKEATGTFVRKLDANQLRQELQGKIDFEIRVWRSVSVRFLRAVIHHPLGGELWLKLIFWLEDRFPHYLGQNGQYPMVLMRKGVQSQ
jgi:SAM-dependent methyltransferase